MNTHLLVYTKRSGEQSSEALEFPNDEQAVICAGSLVSEEIVSVGVQRLETLGSPTRLGLWLWRGGNRQWRAGE